MTARPRILNSDAPRPTTQSVVGEVVALMALASLFVTMANRPLWHTDLWDHVNYGRHILSTRSLPDSEPLLETSSEPMIHSAWGSQVLFAAIDRVEGPNTSLLQLFHSLTVALAVWLIFVAALRARKSILCSLLGGLVFLVVNWQQFIVIRPQTLGLVLFCGVFALLLILPTKRGRSAFGIIALVAVIFAVWVNLHGSFAMGLVLLATYAAGYFLDVFARRRRADDVFRSPSCRSLALTLAGALVAVLFNPRGPLIFVDVVRVGMNANIRDMYEWAPISLSMSQGKLAAIASVATASAMILSDRRLRFSELIPLLVTGGLMLASSRMINWFAPLLGFSFAVHSSAAWNRLRDLRSVKSSGIPNGVRSWKCRWAAASMTLVFAAAFTIPGRVVLGFSADQHQTQSLSAQTPVSTVKFLQERPDLCAKLIFVPAEWSGFLKRFGPRDFSPMINLHVHAIPANVWHDYMLVIRGEPGWNAILADRSIDLVVTDRLHQAALIYELRDCSTFERVFCDRQAEIFLRKPLSR